MKNSIRKIDRKIPIKLTKFKYCERDPNISLTSSVVLSVSQLTQTNDKINKKPKIIFV